MRTIFITMLALAPLSALSASQDNRGSQFKVDARVQGPKVLAVRIHHDMCPRCKQLKPKFEELGSRVVDVPVLLVTLDLSTPATQQQAALMAGALHLESVWTGDLSRIGTVSFLDAESKKTLAEFRADGQQSLKDALRTALR